VVHWAKPKCQVSLADPQLEGKEEERSGHPYSIKKSILRRTMPLVQIFLNSSIGFSLEDTLVPRSSWEKNTVWDQVCLTLQLKKIALLKRVKKLQLTQLENRMVTPMRWCVLYGRAPMHHLRQKRLHSPKQTMGTSSRDMETILFISEDTRYLPLFVLVNAGASAAEGDALAPV